MNKMQTDPIAPAEEAEAPKARRKRKAKGERNLWRTVVMLIGLGIAAGAGA